MTGYGNGNPPSGAVIVTQKILIRLPAGIECFVSSGPGLFEHNHVGFIINSL